MPTKFKEHGIHAKKIWELQFVGQFIFKFLQTQIYLWVLDYILKNQVKVSVKDKNSKNLKKNDQYTIWASLHSKS